MQYIKVRFLKNSDERDQTMDYELVEMTSSYMSLQLDFEDSMLVSQGIISDQIVMKLDKEYFLVPERFLLRESTLAADFYPYEIIIGELPKLI